MQLGVWGRATDRNRDPCRIKGHLAFFHPMLTRIVTADPRVFGEGQAGLALPAAKEATVGHSLVIRSFCLAGMLGNCVRLPLASRLRPLWVKHLQLRVCVRVHACTDAPSRQALQAPSCEPLQAATDLSVRFLLCRSIGGTPSHSTLERTGAASASEAVQVGTRPTHESACSTTQ